MNDDIFGISENSIFKNRAILSAKYLPERLIARDQQVNSIAGILKPVLSHGEPKNALIYGKTGTGKTVVVRYVLKKLNDIIKRKRLKVFSVILNCKEVSTTTHIILEILNNIAPETKVPRSGLSIGEYYGILWKAINENGSTVIVVFDEIDQLKDHNILYNLSRAGENMNIDDGLFIGIIGISNDLFFAESLEPRITSSLGKRDFVFPPYDTQQIWQILKDRSGIAFEEGAVDDEIIELCAKFASQEDGDARKALMLLDIAGEVAERENASIVTREHVDIAYEELNTDCLFETVRTLPIQSKLVLLSIIQLTGQLKDKITTGQVESRYQKMSSQINIKTLGRSSVSKIISEFDMMGIIAAPVRSRGRYGKTRLISINENIDKLEEALFSDYRLRDI